MFNKTSEARDTNVCADEDKLFSIYSSRDRSVHYNVRGQTSSSSQQCTSYKFSVTVQTLTNCFSFMLSAVYSSLSESTKVSFCPSVLCLFSSNEVGTESLNKGS